MLHPSKGGRGGSAIDMKVKEHVLVELLEFTHTHKLFSIAASTEGLTSSSI